MVSEFRLFLDQQGQAWVKKPNLPAEEVAMETFSDELRKSVDVVWVATQLVALGQQFVPGKRQADWMAALPFAVEEQLSQPIERYHLAVLHREVVQQDSIKGQQITFAAVTLEQMQIWQKSLQQLGLERVVLLPDCFALMAPDLQANQGLKYFSQQGIIYRWDVALGAHLPAEFPVAQLTQNQEIEWLETSLLMNSQLPSEMLAKLRAFNLLQGEFAKKSELSLGKWKWSLIILAALFAALLFKDWQSIQQAQKDTLVYQAQTEQLFKQMFPDIKRVVNIRAQTMNRLKGAESGGEILALMPILSQIQTLLQPARWLKVEELRYDIRSGKSELKILLSAKQSSMIQDMETKMKAALPDYDVSIKLKKVQSDAATGELNVQSK